MPTWNRAGLLPAAIHSVGEQTIDAWIEVVIADDGSTDETLQVVNRETARWAGRITVRYLGLKRGGVCAARNMALRESIAPIVAFLDSDDEWEPGKLDAQVGLLTDSVGLVHTDFCYIGLMDGATNQTSQRPNNPAQGRCIRSLLAEDTVIFSSVLMRRTLLDAVASNEPHGLAFDHRWTNGQDYDLLLRAALQTEFGYVSAPLTRYRIHDAQNAMGNLTQAFSYHCRVQVDFARRHGSAAGLTEADGRKAAADFLYSRAESHYWQRKTDVTRKLCELAASLEISDERFVSLRQRASRPRWLFAVKDTWDAALGKPR